MEFNSAFKGLNWFWMEVNVHYYTQLHGVYSDKFTSTFFDSWVKWSM